MSSVESAVEIPKSILKSTNVSDKTTTKRNVRFYDGVDAKGYIAQKPLHVFDLSRSVVLNTSLESYFFSSDVGKSSILKDEISKRTDSNQKFSSNTNVYIVFLREDLPLNFMPEDKANLVIAHSDPNLKIIQIKVKRNTSFEDYIERTINELKSAYIQSNEIPEITGLKDALAASAKTILSAPKSSIVRKRVTFCDLIKLYTAINAYPEAILSYYNLYQNDLKKIDKEFIDNKKALLKKSFRSLDDCEKEQTKLEDERDEAKEAQSKDFIENIKKHYSNSIESDAKSCLESKQMFFYTVSVDDKENKGGEPEGAIIPSPK